MSHDAESDGQEKDFVDFRDEDDWEPLEFPGWVTVAIGVTLVVLASLATWVAFENGSPLAR